MGLNDVVKQKSNNKADVDKSLNSKYTDSRQLTFEEKWVKNFGIKTQIVEHISSIIDIYRFNYVNNLDYLLRYTGNTLRNYTNNQKAKGIRASMTNIRSHINGTSLGFDMFLFAALSSEFKIPVSLLINYNLEEEGIDPGDYGLRRNEHLNPKYKKRDRGFSTESATSMIKNKITRMAKDRASNPVRTFNAYSLIRNSKR